MDRLSAWNNAMLILRGNGEDYLLTPDLDQFPMRGQPLYRELIAVNEFYRSTLTREHFATLERLPDSLRDGDTVFIHDSPFDRPPTTPLPDGIAEKYLRLISHAQGIHEQLPGDAWLRLEQWMMKNGVRTLFCGHTHAPFMRVLGGRRVCNVGSVGIPLDGDTRASWVRWEQNEGIEDRISIRRTAYPVEATIAVIEMTPDFVVGGDLASYIAMLRTATHWKFHYKIS